MTFFIRYMTTMGDVAKAKTLQVPGFSLGTPQSFREVLKQIAEAEGYDVSKCRFAQEHYYGSTFRPSFQFNASLSGKVTTIFAMGYAASGLPVGREEEDDS